MKSRLFILISLILTLSEFLGGQLAPVNAATDVPTAVVVTLDGPLTPVWSSHLKRGIERAVQSNADLLVIELNTPGGGIDLMNDIVQQILASPVPIVVYVSPRGAMAASAGTLVVLAGQLAVMAPESAIGAASPVGLQGENIPSTEEIKTKEILKASVRSLAARRSAAAIQLAEDAIDNAKAASSSEALQAGLIDFVAPDLSSLLQQVDGRSVVVNGQSVVIHSKDAQVITVEPTLLESILGLLTDPNIVFILLAIGVQAIVIEIASPGGWVAGTLGVILVGLAIYGLGILPVNWFGILFLVLAFVLYIVDTQAPTHGALTFAGSASFIVGALILFNSITVPGYAKVSVWLIIGTGLIIGLSFFTVLMVALRAMKVPIVTGREALTGREGFVVTRLEPDGIVQVAGEQWSARLTEGEEPLGVGAKVRVERVEGLHLIVRPATEDNPPQNSMG